MDPCKFLSGTSDTVVASSFRIEWFPLGFYFLKRHSHHCSWMIVVQERRENGFFHARPCLLLSCSCRVSDCMTLPWNTFLWRSTDCNLLVFDHHFLCLHCLFCLAISISDLLFKELLDHVFQTCVTCADVLLLRILLVQGQYSFQLFRLPCHRFKHGFQNVTLRSFFDQITSSHRVFTAHTLSWPHSQYFEHVDMASEKLEGVQKSSLVRQLQALLWRRRKVKLAIKHIQKTGNWT